MTCVNCGFKSYLKNRFMAYFKQHDNIVCPINNCKQSYSKYSSFSSSHVSRSHPCFRAVDIRQHHISINTLDRTVISSFNNIIPVDDFSSHSKLLNEILENVNDFLKNVFVYFKNARKAPFATDNYLRTYYRGEPSTR